MKQLRHVFFFNPATCILYRYTNSVIDFSCADCNITFVCKFDGVIDQVCQNLYDFISVKINLWQGVIKSGKQI